MSKYAGSATSSSSAGSLAASTRPCAHSLLHKLRKSRKRTFVATDDNVAWLLDEVRALRFQRPRILPLSLTYTFRSRPG